ncbi:gap junction protein alpha 9b [Cynoglossus semilaevis]|uniref:Gap junction protein n=1 Tax=Cynoglossus semilaevis TaxID=244447 RepID=A0A3P8VBE4_CYNSE|nr:gap junction alpha-9 protein-like [Cynoglossus semilaevis]
MGDWNFLGGILEEVHIHSTMVGKIWLTILFIFRMLVLGVAAEDVWNDEQSDFICNTDQPGCRNVCYDHAFPISLIRYWVLQVIFVSSPSLVYMGHAIYQLRALEKERHCKKVALRRELEAVDLELVEVRRRIEKEMRQVEQGRLNKAPLRGSLLCTYVAHIVTRSMLEVSFMMGQYVLYGPHLSPLYKCEQEPCPNVVDCFVSRPTEKSVFMMFMLAIACISLFLSLLEIMHLTFKKLKKGILDYYPHLKDDLDEFYVDKSKKNSVVHQVHKGTSVGHKTTIATAPSGYTFLVEKQGNGPNYPPLHTSAGLTPTQGGAGPKPQGCKDSKEGTSRPTEKNSSSNNTSSETRSPPTNKQEEQEEPEEPEEPEERTFPNHKDLEFPTLPVADIFSCSALSGIGRKSRRVSALWNCSTVVEGNGTDSSDSCPGLGSCVAPRTSLFSRSDSRRPTRSQSPESAEEMSSASRHSRDSNSPVTSSPNRKGSAVSVGSNRRALTDLQI